MNTKRQIKRRQSNTDYLLEEEAGAGVTINPIAFLVITTDNVRLIPVNHSSSLDRLIDYMPDLIEKTNQMMNRCIQNKKDTTEKIIKEMSKKGKQETQTKNNTKKDLHSISEAQIFLRYHFIIQLQDQASHPPGQILHKFCRY